MDPLTHTLVGASLASTRLGRTTRLATPALVIGANLPDVDVFSYVRGGDFALGFRRGLTHGVPALVLLPLLLAGALWVWSRRWPEERRRQVSPAWLVGLSYLAVLTHPALDWLNTYGMRWSMPIDESWSYGDSLLIMDPWLWLILGVGWLLPRRPTRGVAITGAVVAGLLLWIVASNAPPYVPVVGLVTLTMAAACFARVPRTGRSVATLALALGALYIASMIGLRSVTEGRVRAALASAGSAPVRLMVGPMPANPLRWDVLLEESHGYYRFGTFSWRRRALELTDDRLPKAPREWLATWETQIPGFLRWTRFPWSHRAPHGDGRVYVMDARYARSEHWPGFGRTSVEPPLADPPPQRPPSPR